MRPQSSLIQSFYYAFEGIKTAFKEEPNFKIHVLVTSLVLLLAILSKFSLGEWLILIFTISFVLVVELINTSLEEIVNLVRPEVHPLAKKAKDIMAAGVLIAATTAFIIGILLFAPKLLTLVQ
jgi:diacylglycerol kinase